MNFFEDSDGLTNIEVVLTDFASPECFTIKSNSSDIFSLGRVFLFLLLPTTEFLSFLYLPIPDIQYKRRIRNLIIPSSGNKLLHLILKMTRIRRLNEGSDEFSHKGIFRINKCEIIRHAIHDFTSSDSFIDSSLISWYLGNLYSAENDYNNLSLRYIRNLDQLS